MNAQEIRDMALQCGACEMINEANSIPSLVKLMSTPQGREFCKMHRFPSIDTLRNVKDEVESMNVYVDAGNIEIDNKDNVVIAGGTTAVIRYTMTDMPYHAVVMHGAKAKVIAYGYSVCEVINIGGDITVHKSNNASVFIR